MTYFAFEDLAITRMISILLDNSDGLGQSVWCGVVKQLPHNTGTSSFGSKKYLWAKNLFQLFVKDPWYQNDDKGLPIY